MRIEYDAEGGERYILNLIDTPGHVVCMVSRSMRAVEGSLLDSTHVERTLANVYQAIDDHEIVPFSKSIFRKRL